MAKKSSMESLGAFKFTGDALEIKDVIATGSLGLDKALGVGGIPRRKITEIYGNEGSGKTTLCLHIVANAQRQGLTCAYIDMEHALVPDYMKTIGVNLDDLWIMQPDSGEMALDVARAFFDEIDLVVVDSVAALVPKAELDGQAGDAHMGLQARLMSQAMRRMSPFLTPTDTTLVFTNQVRSTIGGYGPSKTTSGGRALRFYASVRIEVAHIKQFIEKGDVIGSYVRARVRKNKVAPPFKETVFPLIYGKGIDLGEEAVEIGVELGFIEKNHAWLTYNSIKAQGSTKLIAALEEENKMETLIEDVKNALRKG